MITRASWLAVATLAACQASESTSAPDATPPGDDASLPPDARRCQPAGRYTDMIFDAAEIRVRHDLLYAVQDDIYGTHRLSLDVYLPPEDDVVTARPAIVWIHGGSFRIGNRTNMTGYAIEFARRGWVAASIDYRLLRALDPEGEHCETGPGGACSPEACAAVAQQDAEAAIAFLGAGASSLGIDPARIVVGGFSAGSYTSFTVGYEYEKLGKAVPSVIGVAGLDGVGSTPDDLVAGDPPFILISSDGTPPDDGGGIDEFLAAASALGIANTRVTIPDTVHTDLVKTAFVPTIAAEVAPFLHQHALGCAAN